VSTRLTRAIVIALLILAIIGCDQASKQAARTHLAGRGTVDVVGSYFVMVYVENEGAFLSLGARLPGPVRMAIFGILPFAALVIVVVAMLRSRSLSWLLLAGLSCIAGGGFGNLTDRLFHGGRVSDFLNFGIGSVRTGILNVADLAITTGCVLLLLAPSGRKPGAGEERPPQ